jgi:hypothetical protein
MWRGIALHRYCMGNGKCRKNIYMFVSDAPGIGRLKRMLRKKQRACACMKRKKPGKGSALEGIRLMPGI